ncbi:MAG: hypothetical protein FWE31_00230 [Firmicutes bacterium]|nr:hypothetical protein [Bacillota bacterium]
MEKNKVNFKQSIVNILVLIFVAVISAVAFFAFFVAVFTTANPFAYYIASLYVLCMLLAAPTLKVFMDKKETPPVVQKLNLAGIITIFSMILLFAMTTFIYLAV